MAQKARFRRKKEGEGRALEEAQPHRRGDEDADEEGDLIPIILAFDLRVPVRIRVEARARLPLGKAIEERLPCCARVLPAEEIIEHGRRVARRRVVEGAAQAAGRKVRVHPGQQVAHPGVNRAPRAGTVWASVAALSTGRGCGWDL